VWSSPLRIAVVTDIPSPYQIELFNAIARLDGFKLFVIYIRRSDKERAWERIPMSHEHCLLYETALTELSLRISSCDLAVFSGYRPRRVARLIKLRDRAAKAWAFWGERPGFRFPGWFGRQYRAWALRKVRSSGAPVWGIGEWAVQGYRSELGGGRPFFNVPYFSNLAPFFAIERKFEPGEGCRFLFSGSFTRRKGIDLLVSAFERLIADGVNAELSLLGAGPLENLLKSKCQSCPGKVRLHGFRQWWDLASAYAEADVLCAPSRYDGWGLVVVEGLAAGMPVISTDRTGAARELLEPSNGWLLPADNEKALYQAMRSAAALGTNHRRMMAQNARKNARGQDVEVGAQCFVRAAEATIGYWQSNQGSDELRN
jgi:glycosyltransferase involved in cell wall biosynthesis